MFPVEPLLCSMSQEGTQAGAATGPTYVITFLLAMTSESVQSAHVRIHACDESGVILVSDVVKHPAVLRRSEKDLLNLTPYQKALKRSQMKIRMIMPPNVHVQHCVVHFLGRVRLPLYSCSWPSLMAAVKSCHCSLKGGRGWESSS